MDTHSLLSSAAGLRPLGAAVCCGGIELGYSDLSALASRITSDLLGKRLARGPVPLIDVRAESEWRQEAIRGSVNIPLQHLRERINEIPEGPIVVYCRTGERSSTAASLLEQTGRMNVVDLVGGIAAWKASGYNGTLRQI